MKILIKRTYLREDSTQGYLQVILSGEYESQCIDAQALKPHPTGGKWLALCDTLEPHAIAWEDKPLIGQYRGQRIAGKTAIPEGTYPLQMLHSPTYKRVMPYLMDVRKFRGITLKPGTKLTQTRGDILVGNRHTHALLCALIAEAMDHGEEVTVQLRSPRGWTFPKI